MQFKVKCNWVVESEITVEAFSKKEAIEKVYNIDTKDFPSPTYVDDSFEIALVLVPTDYTTDQPLQAEVDPYEVEEEHEESIPDTVRDGSILSAEVPINNNTQCIAWENGKMCCEPVYPRAGIRVCYDHLKCGPNDEPINPGPIIPGLRRAHIIGDKLGTLTTSDRIIIVR